ncbi:MAG: hypothetical protein HZA79_16195 [Sphingobacteriales bacterium]|nr:hypothetical protein [Sphingobacteriales bacterium]
MKKTGVLILSFIYLAFTAGITLQRHYCMNRLVSLRLSAHTGERCGFCGMDTQATGNGCCKDEASTFRISDDQQPGPSVDFVAPPAGPDYCPSFVTGPGKRLVDNVTMELTDHGPPGKTAVPVFLLHRVFRI